eukprot:1152560-Pelagomonas_calceolata.AAC.3
MSEHLLAQLGLLCALIQALALQVLCVGRRVAGRFSRVSALHGSFHACMRFHVAAQSRPHLLQVLGAQRLKLSGSVCVLGPELVKAHGQASLKTYWNRLKTHKNTLFSHHGLTTRKSKRNSCTSDFSHLPPDKLPGRLVKTCRRALRRCECGEPVRVCARVIASLNILNSGTIVRGRLQPYNYTQSTLHRRRV